MGLWVSKGFVEQHGGSITATSEGNNKGSTFIITLPVLQLISDFVPNNYCEDVIFRKHASSRNITLLQQNQSRVVPIDEDVELRCSQLVNQIVKL